MLTSIFHHHQAILTNTDDTQRITRGNIIKKPRYKWHLHHINISICINFHLTSYKNQPALGYFMLIVVLFLLVSKCQDKLKSFASVESMEEFRSTKSEYILMQLAINKCLWVSDRISRLWKSIFSQLFVIN